MSYRPTLVMLAGLAAATTATAAHAGLACMAPTDPKDTGTRFAELERIEFYLDTGNPLAAYTVPFSRLTTRRDPEGHTVNTYGVWGSKREGASIAFFADDTPLTFRLDDIRRTAATLRHDDDETASMADAVPGIDCWTVEIEDAR